MFLKKIKKERGKKTETSVRACVFNAGLLARSQLLPEGPATGQLDQGFPWFSLVPKQMLSWYPALPMLAQKISS
jgi:hypothetical protein